MKENGKKIQFARCQTFMPCPKTVGLFFIVTKHPIQKIMISTFVSSPSMAPWPTNPFFEGAQLRVEHRTHLHHLPPFRLVF